MNFYKLTMAVITLIVVAITATGFLLFSKDPCSTDTLLQAIPILFAELQCGLFLGLALNAKNARSLPFFLTHSVLDGFYLIFTIIMACFSPAQVGIARYIFIHLVAAFALLGILKLLLGAGLRNFNNQEKADNKTIAVRRNCFYRMTAILEQAKHTFAANPALVKKCQKVCDDFRWSGDAFCPSAESFDAMLSQLQTAVQNADTAAMEDVLVKISIEITCCQKHTAV